MLVLCLTLTLNLMFVTMFDVVVVFDVGVVIVARDNV